MMGRRGGAALLAALMLTGCGSSPALPDQADARVQAETQELALVVADDLEAKERAGGGPVGEWTCLALLLGHDGEAQLGSVNCSATYPGVEEPSGMAGPVRVEGAAVRYSQDGAGYADSVREMFGNQLADYYLDQ